MNEASEIRAWVLVAGGGRVPANDPIVQLSAEEVGRALAEQGCGLVSNGWYGVDLLTIRAFAGRCRELGIDPGDRILQFLRADHRQEEPIGHVVRVAAGIDEWLDAPSYADAVVLLAGRDGTNGVFLSALQQGLPRFPVPATGLAAGDAYKQMDRLWRVLGNPGMSHEAFKALHLPVSTREDAAHMSRVLVTSLLECVAAGRRSGPRRLPLRVMLSHHVEDERWAQDLRTHLRPMERAGLVQCWSPADIRSGEEEGDEVAEHVRECDVAVAFLTGRYLGSDDLVQKQLSPLCARAAARQARLLWFVLSPCDWKSVAPLASRKPVLPEEQPLQRMSASEAQAALVEIVCAVRRIAEEVGSAFEPPL